MTNTIAIWLGLLIVGLFVLDHFYLEWELPLFVLEQLNRAIKFIAIWR